MSNKKKWARNFFLIRNLAQNAHNDSISILYNQSYSFTLSQSFQMLMWDCSDNFLGSFWQKKNDG